MAKIRKETPERPAYLCARLIFDFFNNDDVDFKNNSIKRVAKELRREYNVSASPVHDTMFDNPERGVLVIALAAPSEAAAKQLAEQVLAFLDTNMPGRLTAENWLGEEFLEE